ncbi:hypothetical protein Tco_1468981, partial [Tanacetum coccineum]
MLRSFMCVVMMHKMTELVEGLGFTTDEKERIYFRSMVSSYDREAADVRRAWSQSGSRSQATKAQIRALQRNVN